MRNTYFFIFLAIFCVFVESIFSMFEMAILSLNKVKLHYSSSKKIKNAIWLEFLLKKPSYLFGTTIIVVNFVMQIGSEAARRFYESLNLNVAWAPFTQILIVLVFAELSPLFAARKHSEHVAYMFVPIIYIISKILRPLVWLIDKISIASNFLFKKAKKSSFLSKEELQKALEEPSKIKNLEKQNIDKIIGNIFSLKIKKAKEIMQSFNELTKIPSNFKINQLASILDFTSTYFPIYHHNQSNIVSIAHLRDLLKANEDKRVIDYGCPPWFITENTYVMDILKQFRFNNQSIAIVLDKTGKSKGFITLDQIETQIFGQMSIFEDKKTKVLIEKKFPGDMSLDEFNKLFHSKLQLKKAKTLSDLIIALLDHFPSIDEVVYFDKYEFSVVSTSLLGIEELKVKSVF